MDSDELESMDEQGVDVSADPTSGTFHVSWLSSIISTGYLESLKSLCLEISDHFDIFWSFGVFGRFLSTLDRCSVMLSMSSFAFPSRSDLATATWRSDRSSIKHVAEVHAYIRHLFAPLLYTALQTVKKVSACLNNNKLINAQSPFVCTSPHPHGHKASPSVQDAADQPKRSQDP